MDEEQIEVVLDEEMNERSKLGPHDP